MTAQPPDRAIVVGVGRYPRLGQRGTPRNLDGPARDAKAVAEWLHHQGQHVTLITSDGITSDGVAGSGWTVTDLRPETPDVQRSLESLADEAENLVNQGEPGRICRRLTLYMAGHGVAPDRKNLALITAEASAGRLANIVATQWIDWFADQIHFDELVLLMDCCTLTDHSLTGLGPIGLRKTVRQGLPAKVVAIWAAGPNQLAYERPDADGVVRGVFTAELLRALDGAAIGEDGRVTTSSLMRYFQSRGLASGETSRAVTQDVLAPHFRDADELVFNTVAAPPTYRIHTNLPPGTPVRVEKGGPAALFDGPVGVDGVVAMQLPIGIYALRTPGGSRYFEIGAGSDTDVHPN